jgi:hypothetical protein
LDESISVASSAICWPTPSGWFAACATKIDASER